MIQAQQPSYYLIGEKECAGIDLYSITQDKKGDIWLSSNQGLLRYDGYTFHHYTSNQLKSNSLFGLKKDRKGTIYCNNLVGQFFRIQNDSLHLFAEIPDSLFSNQMEFNFDNRNRLIFRTINYYEIDGDGNIRLILKDKETTVRNIPSNNRDELVLVDPSKNQLLFYKDGNLTIENKPDFDILPSEMRLFFNLEIRNNQLLIHGQRMPKIFKEHEGQWQAISFENFESLQTGWNTYLLSNDRIWLANERNGARVFDHEGNAYYQGVNLLPRFRISCYLEDVEGNLWLPTLGKGIIVIPNQTFIDYRNHPLLNKDDILSIDIDQDGKVYLGGISGNIYQIEKGEVSIFQEGAEKINFLHYLKEEDALIFGSKKIDLSKAKSKTNVDLFSKGKDIIRLDDDQYLTATFSGIEYINTEYKLNNPLSQYLRTFKNAKLIDTTLISFLVVRTFTLAWDSNRRYIWAGTSKGLKVIQPDTIKSITFNEQSIIATSILYEDEKTWIATRNHGILVYDQDSLVLHLHQQNGLLSNHILKIVLKDNLLYLISKEGLQQYDIVNRSFNNFTQSDGLLSKLIIDFAVHDTTAWMVFQNGVQKIPLNKFQKKKNNISLAMHQILVNGKNVAFDQKGQFNYNQNELSFEYLVKGHRHRGQLTYHYQLEGWKNEWSSDDFLDNKVEYKSLPPGDYRFLVKAIDQNQTESPTLVYSFSIQYPFWLTSWFLFGCIISVALIIVSIFKIRESIISQRLQLENKLKTSEITALKAQMNPHFIFNTLNSIQDLILMNDIRASNIYLGKFADLMRMILNASGKNTISLSDEIDLLSLYLEIETLRFGEDFTTNIHTNLTQQQQENIRIPPLLIQPYVENAIKHGLLHKKGKKRLEINFFLKDQALHSTISDNGIGLKKSAQIKARRKKNHLSFATTANRKRIDLINAANHKKISFSIKDLAPDQEDSGTIVHLVFPK